VPTLITPLPTARDPSNVPASPPTLDSPPYLHSGRNGASHDAGSYLLNVTGVRSSALAASSVLVAATTSSTSVDDPSAPSTADLTQSGDTEVSMDTYFASVHTSASEEPGTGGDTPFTVAGVSSLNAQRAGGAVMARFERSQSTSSFSSIATIGTERTAQIDSQAAAAMEQLTVSCPADGIRPFSRTSRTSQRCRKSLVGDAAAISADNCDDSESVASVGSTKKYRYQPAEGSINGFRPSAAFFRHEEDVHGELEDEDVPTTK
jgi:hypothetical protein